MPRLACLRVPLFSLAARLRCEPELLSEAVVVLEGKGTSARVTAASRRARKGGIRPGMTLAQARALLPRLLTRPRDPETETTAQEALLEVADTVSPRVEDGGEGLAYLDLDGCTARFGAGDPEAELARFLVREAEAAGLPARVGIGGTKLAAEVASTVTPTPRVVPPGEDSAFLSPLPLSRLDPELEIAETLRLWGLRSIGDFARLPPSQISSRLGESGRRLHGRARGIDSRPLVARCPPSEFREGMSLEWPLVSLEPFLFSARSSLERLCQRLERAGLACARLELGLQLEPDGFHERSFTLPAPTREAKTLLTILRLELEKDPPGAPVAGFRLAAVPDRPRSAQLTLFGPPEIPPDRLATTLARLFALLDRDRVGAPVCPDGHRPERFGIAAYRPPPPPEVRPEAPPARGHLAIRVLRPPVPLEVHTAARNAHETGARPVRIETPAREERAPKIRGSVRVASGPWEMEEGWWQGEEAVDREYWDVELDRGDVYRVYRDRPSGDWFADGVYD